jgi:selT/selW/selH-like putative selenoprotein
VSAANEILDHWAPILVGVELKTGTKGAFEVAVDRATVFSKKEERRFPRDGELATLLEARLGPDLRWRASR